MSAIAYVFYGTLLITPLFLPFGLYFYYDSIASLTERKQRVFLSQFQEALALTAQSLQTGYSLENSIREANRELNFLYPPDTHIIRSFSQIVAKIDLNTPIERALDDFSRETALDDVSDFIFVFSAAKKMGGDSIEVIRSCVALIKEKLDTEQEIHLLLTAKKMEFHVMCAVPFFIILYLKFMFANFISALYFTPAGIFIMSICLIIFSMSYMAGRKIIRIRI